MKDRAFRSVGTMSSVTTHIENSLEGAYREQLWNACRRYFENCIEKFALSGKTTFTEELEKFNQLVEVIELAHSDIKKRNNTGGTDG